MGCVKSQTFANKKYRKKFYRKAHDLPGGNKSQQRVYSYNIHEVMINNSGNLNYNGIFSKGRNVIGCFL